MKPMILEQDYVPAHHHVQEIQEGTINVNHHVVIMKNGRITNVNAFQDMKK